MICVPEMQSHSIGENATPLARTPSPPASGLPAIAVDEHNLERLEGSPDVEQALLSAMHLLTSSDEADLPQILNHMAEAIGADRLALYVLGAGESNARERGASERGASERGASERGASERGASERGASERGASTAQTKQGASFSPGGGLEARRGAGTRTDVHVAEASEESQVLKKILRAHASGWLIPVLSPAQRLHGYLDALPAARKDFGKLEGRALQYLCSLLAGYFDRWKDKSPQNRGEKLPSEVQQPSPLQEPSPLDDGAPARGEGTEPPDRRVAEALEEQQEYIGKELHDNIGQLLTSIRMLGENLATGRSDAGAAKSRADRIAQLAGEAATQVSEIHRLLSPPDLCKTPLAAALEELADRMNELSETHCFFHCAETDRGIDLPEEAKLHLYRIAQEAANNAMKYAGARRIHIGLDFEAADGPHSALVLRIQDDGQGFGAGGSSERGPAEGGASSGLRNMAYRAEAAGGTLQVASEPGRGTTIMCTVPQAPED